MGHHESFFGSKPHLTLCAAAQGLLHGPHPKQPTQHAILEADPSFKAQQDARFGGKKALAVGP